MNIKNLATTLMKILFVLTLLFQIQAVHAEGHGGGGEGGGGAYSKLDLFTVNLQGLSQYLQVAITLKNATPEAGVAITEYMPIIRHALILLLSSKDATQISTLEGKTSLGNEAKVAINKVIKMTDKQGVSGVLFESFIIQ